MAGVPRHSRGSQCGCHGGADGSASFASAVPGREGVSIRVAKELQRGPTYPTTPAHGNQRHHPTWHCPSAPDGTVTGLGGVGGWLVQDPPHSLPSLPGKASLLTWQGDSGCSHLDVLRDIPNRLRDTPDVLRDTPGVLRNTPDVLMDPRSAHRPQSCSWTPSFAHKPQICSQLPRLSPLGSFISHQQHQGRVRAALPRDSGITFVCARNSPGRAAITLLPGYGLNPGGPFPSRKISRMF